MTTTLVDVSDWLRDFQFLLFNRLRNGFFFFWGGGGGEGVLTGINGKQMSNMYELSTLRHAVLVMIPQLCGSLQGFALFHIIIKKVRMSPLKWCINQFSAIKRVLSYSVSKKPCIMYFFHRITRNGLSPELSNIVTGAREDQVTSASLDPKVTSNTTTNPYATTANKSMNICCAVHFNLLTLIIFARLTSYFGCKYTVLGFSTTNFKCTLSRFLGVFLAKF